jgi:hypothetical protein
MNTDEDLRHDEMDKSVNEQLNSILEKMTETNDTLLSNLPDSYTRMIAQDKFSSYIKWMKFGFGL